VERIDHLKCTLNPELQSERSKEEVPDPGWKCVLVSVMSNIKLNGADISGPMVSLLSMWFKTKRMCFTLKIQTMRTGCGNREIKFIKLAFDTGMMGGR
jgi:hypothetical protein